MAAKKFARRLSLEYTQFNDLEHLSKDVTAVGFKQDAFTATLEKNNELLQDIASGIRVLVDQGTRL